MSTELEEIIKVLIAAKGCISVAEYMELALSHPEYGYYMRRDPLGAEGDFTTAPEISQVFGEIIGAWLAHRWQLMGAPQDIALVELGAGRGTLMADILRATKNAKAKNGNAKNGKSFHEAISVHLVEISPALRQKQWKALVGKHPRLEWHDSIDTLPEKPLLLVANEFFDALPIRQFVGDKERMIGIGKNGDLQFVPEKSPEDIKADDIRETCPPAVEIMARIARRIKEQGGAAIIIDYGYTGGSRGDTLQAMKNHSYHSVLADAGAADITAHVDFDALAEAARGVGVKVEEIMPQGAFLMRMGAGERTTMLCQTANHEQQKSLISGLKRLADPEQMGSLFKVLILGGMA